MTGVTARRTAWILVSGFWLLAAPEAIEDLLDYFDGFGERVVESSI